MKLPDNVVLMPISGDAIARLQARKPPLALSTYARRYNWERTMDELNAISRDVGEGKFEPREPPKSA